MSRLFYNIKQALIQIGRNKSMALASVFAIMAMMLILGVFFVITVNVNLFTESIKKDYDTIEVYLEDNLTQARQNQIKNEIGSFKGVASVTFRSKKQALKIMKDRWGENGYLLDSLESNPLPDSLLVKVKTLEESDTVNSRASRLKGVEGTRYYKETVRKLTRVTNFLQVGMIAVMLFLIVVSVVVVSNTIKLTVFARSKEISIMKYLGATNWFIRGPFLVEGILIGVFSSLISAVITYSVYKEAIDLVQVQIMTIFATPLVSPEYLSMNLIVIFLAMGIGIGASGSIISMRRFLNV